jgi:hypothetical protein
MYCREDTKRRQLAAELPQKPTALPLQKALRLRASARNNSIYSVSLPNHRYPDYHSSESPKNHTNCCFPAEAQRRRVNTFIKRNLPLTMPIHRKKLRVAA